MIEEKKKHSSESKSTILGGIKRFTDWIYKKVSSGFVGRVFNSYTKENNAFKNSFANAVLGSRSKLAELIRKLRFVVAEQFEDSRILKTWRRFMCFLAGAKLRLYGSFMMSFGIYVGLVYFMKRYIISGATHDMSYVVCSIIFTLCSIPLVISGKTFSQAIVSSKAGHFIASDIFGIPEEKLKVTQSKRGDAYNAAIFVGIALGTLSYLIDPLYVFVAIGLFIAFSLIVTYPEIGVLVTVVLLPLLSVGNGIDILKWIILTFSVTYFVKLIRGKRVISFEIIDLVILFFSVLIAFAGTVSLGGEGAVDQANTMLCLIVGCFVAGNLMRTREWIKRCIFAFVFSGGVTAALVVWDASLEYFGDIFGSKLNMLDCGSLSLFGSKHMLAAFLTVSLAFTVANVYSAQKIKHKFLLLFSTVMLVAAIVIVGSTAGLIGMLVALVVFFLIASRRTVPVMIWLAFAGVIAVTVFPLEWLTKIIPAFDITSPTAYSVIKTWNGVIKMLMASLFAGVGMGGMSEVYPLYAESGFEQIGQSSSLWLRILCDVGVTGLIIFVIIIFLYLQNCFEYIRKPLNKGSKIYIVASVAAITGLLALSATVDVWSNTVIFYQFWMIITLACSGIRVNRRLIEKQNIDKVNSECSASVDL